MGKYDEYYVWIKFSIGLIYLILMCIQFWSTPIGDIHFGMFILNMIFAVLIFLAIIGIGLLIIIIFIIIGGLLS